MNTPATPTKLKINYAVEQRLRMIDFLLFHYKRINRSVIMDYFGISAPQASLDIQAYLVMAGDGVRYDKTNKCYVTTPTFVRQYA